ncbi:hypothetical protein BC832DRAFT_568552 [Gaertneriomyces semiglobifer]|nr:hypothetical protein BC832DRAFT_568552 [Gaertneriomyces semiglobifer]
MFKTDLLPEMQNARIQYSKFLSTQRKKNVSTPVSREKKTPRFISKNHNIHHSSIQNPPSTIIPTITLSPQPATKQPQQSPFAPPHPATSHPMVAPTLTASLAVVHPPTPLPHPHVPYLSALPFRPSSPRVSSSRRSPQTRSDTPHAHSAFVLETVAEQPRKAVASGSVLAPTSASGGAPQLVYVTAYVFVSVSAHLPRLLSCLLLPSSLSHPTCLHHIHHRYTLDHSHPPSHPIDHTLVVRYPSVPYHPLAQDRQKAV